MKKVLFSFSLLLFLLSSCGGDDLAIELDEDTLAANEYVIETMKEWYLWNTEMPELEADHYATPRELIRALAVNPEDRWTTVNNLQNYSSFYEAGQYVGYGYGLEDPQDRLVVTFVYEDSPFGEMGITRGYEIIKINGIPISDISNLSNETGAAEEGVSAEFTLIDLQGDTTTVSATKRVCTIDPVPYYDIIEHNGRRVGIMGFLTFIEPAITAFDEAFAYFESEGVDEFILDLRYNRGGRVDVAMNLCERVMPPSAVGQVGIKFSHNAMQAAESDSDILFEAKPNDLGLNRVFILATDRSASASELVINALKPYMEVLQIGKRSYGKPVGSYGFEFGEYVVSPISFKVLNAQDVGCYFNGISPDVWVAENYYVDWLAINDYHIQQSLYYIENGTWDETIEKAASWTQPAAEPWKPNTLSWEINSW